MFIQIAGGTGITPMLQVIEAILKNPDDKTQVSIASHIVIYVTLSNNFLLMYGLPMLHVCVCVYYNYGFKCIRIR